MNKFFVLEGLDGSGKSTQVSLIKSYFDQININYKFVHFPQTNTPFFGEMIARFLRGEFGDIQDLDPYLVAMLYAGDRFSASTDIREWLAIGAVVVVDRYVMSNIAFQCAKLSTTEEKKKLRNWIFNFEYNYYQIPRPALSIFLDAPMDFIQENLQNERIGHERDYLKGKQDIHEAKIEFQSNVREEYLEAIKLDNSFKYINCAENNRIKKPQEIFEEIKCLFNQHNLR